MTYVRHPVGAEWLGKARELRRVLGDEEKLAIAQIAELVKPLHLRAKRSPTPDRAALAHVARTWSGIHPYGRLSLDIKHQRTNLSVIDIRAGACSLRGHAWDDGEQGIALNHLIMTIRKCHMTMDIPILGVVGLHAIARRLSRGWSSDTDTILAEFALLARHAASLMQQHNFRLPVTDGVWVGEVIAIDGQHAALRIQTFLTH